MKLFFIIFGAILSAAAVIWLFFAIPAAIENNRQREASLAAAKANLERLEQIRAEMKAQEDQDKAYEERQKQLARDRIVMLDNERVLAAANRFEQLVESMSKYPDIVGSRDVKTAILEHANVYSAALRRAEKSVAIPSRDRFAIAWTRIKMKAKTCPTWDPAVTQIVDNICADAASVDLRN